MKDRRNTDLTHLLSLYIDGMLDDTQRTDIERALREDEALRTEYESLKRTTELLRTAPTLSGNPFLTEKTLNSVRRDEERNNLPLSIPAKYLPAFAGLVGLLLITVGVFTWWQGGGHIVSYVESTSEEMQRLYEEDILKGWIMPLFQRTDEENALEFAMFGTLSLDADETTTLRIDPSASDGYRVEFGAAPAIMKRRVSLDELYESIQPNPEQRQTFDTLFSEARRHIESSVLLDRQQRIAIDPALPQYQKMLLTTIASQLDKDQHRRFQEFLAQHNTTYALASHSVDAPRVPHPSHVFFADRGAVNPTDFVVITADSVGVGTLRLNLDSLRKLMLVIEDRIPRIDEPLRQLARAYSRQAARVSVTQQAGTQHVRVLPAETPDALPAISLSIDGEVDEVFRVIDSEMEKVAREMIVLRRITPARPPQPLRPGSMRERERNIRVRVAVGGNRMGEVRPDSIVHDLMKELRDLGEPDAIMDSLGKAKPRIDLRQLFGPDGSIRITLDSLGRISIPGSIRLPEQHELELEWDRMSVPREMKPLAPPEYHVPSPSRRRDAPPPPSRPPLHPKQDIARDSSVHI